MVLRDGNSTIYPLAKDCADAVRDPQCLDLPPVRCIAAGTLALTGTAHNMKNQVAVVAFALEQLLLMPKILRCEVEGARLVLAQLEIDCRKCIGYCIILCCLCNCVFFQETTPALCSQYSMKDVMEIVISFMPLSACVHRHLIKKATMVCTLKLYFLVSASLSFLVQWGSCINNFQIGRTAFKVGISH